MKKPVELKSSTRLLNHGPTVLVTSASGGKTNVMTAAWCMPLDYSPPKIAIVIESSTFSRELIDASGCFGINIPPRAIAELTLNLGRCSGREENKFTKFNISHFPAKEINVPLIESCVGWLECKVVSEPHNQEQYDLFIADVVAAWADDRAFANGRWIPSSSELQTLHHVAAGTFVVASEMIDTKK